MSINKIRLFIAFFIFFNAVLLRGQNVVEPRCGFDALWHKTDSLVIKDVQQFDNDLKRALNDNKMPLNNRSVITIPVVVHIVNHPLDENVSDAVVLSQIDILNKCFNAKNSDLDKVPIAFKQLIAKQGIAFCLANKDTNGLPTMGITRTKTTIKNIGLTKNLFETQLGGSNNWNPDKYLNIWVANTGESITGIGSYPNLVPANQSGVVIHPRYFGKNASTKFGLGRVAVHEIGHYFGLYHTWGQMNDTICLTNDDVDDTPPQLYAYVGCPTYPQYSCNASNLFMNYMDYVNDPCMFLFTEGQMQRMLKTIEVYRSGLLTANAACVDTSNDNPLNCLIFPNPTSGQLKIEWLLDQNQNTEGGTVQVFNLLGQQLMQQLIPSQTGYVQLDMQSFSSGVYYLFVRISGKGVFSQKIIIIK